MGNFKEIKKEELKKWIEEKKDFFLFDVLSQDSYEVKHLPRAKHAAVGEGNFLEEIEKVVSNKEAIIVVYCASFTCQLSSRAATMLIEEGYTNIYDFKGGLADWQDAEYSFAE